MRILVITRDGFEHNYVTNLLCDQLPILAVILDHGKKQTRIEKAKSVLSRYSLFNLIWRSFGKFVSIVSMDSTQTRQAAFRILGKENCFLRASVPTISVAGLNNEETLLKIRALEPDLLLVYGTGIVGRRLLKLPKYGSLNMHTGVSPFYRGADCAFWPLFNRDLNMLGATVHDCTSDVDGGGIHAVRRVKLEENDNLFSVFFRTVKEGAEIYLETVQRFVINGVSQGMKQDFDQGREYRAVMKSWWKVLQVKRMIRNGLIRKFVTNSELLNEKCLQKSS